MQTSRRRQLANAIRALAMDAVQKANSGHPGMPMGMADIAQVLWDDHLRHNPGNPQWADRDRFVVSNGHGSMLLYALLHLTGYPLTVEHLKAFRQLGSPTAGHPEHEPHLGIETTTGPLGQGLANAVGMALAEKWLARDVQSPRLRRRRSSDVGVPRRRLPDGRSFARGLLAGRHAQARQADRVLRRQRHFDRRRGARLVHRRHAEALRGVRLARRPQCRRPRSAGGRGRNRRGQGAHGSSHADLLQDHHRLRCAEQAGHRSDARRCAGRGRSRRGPPPARLAVRAVRDSGRHSPRLGCARARRRAGSAVARAIQRLPRRVPRAGCGIRATDEGRLARRRGATS